MIEMWLAEHIPWLGARIRRKRERIEWLESFEFQCMRREVQFCEFIVKNATSCPAFRGKTIGCELYDEIVALGSDPNILETRIGKVGDIEKVITFVVEVDTGSAILRAAAKKTGKVFQTRSISMTFPLFGDRYHLVPQP